MRNPTAFLLVTLWVVITAQIGASAAGADVVPPVNLQLKEVDSETVLAQWKVPVQIPVEATPRLIVPPHCLSKGDQATADQPGGRVMTESFRCDGGIAGEEVGIEFPFYNASFTTMVRAELRSGEQFVQVLNPGEERWTLPEGSTGLRQDPWTHLERGVATGIGHAWTSLAHWLLAVALCLLGGRVVAVRLTTTFLAGQLLGVGIQTVLGLEVDPTLAEAGVVLSVVLLAVQALAPTERRVGLELLTVAGGLVHGLGVSSLIGVPPSFSGLEWLYSGLAVLGMDGLLLLAVVSITAALSWLARFDWCPAFKRALTYGLGAAGVATVLTLVLIVPVDELEAEPGGVGLPSLSLASTGSGPAGSRALAAQSLQDPVQVFVTIDPFETRLETLVRLREFARRIDVEPDAVLEPAAQPRVKNAVLDHVGAAVEVTIDGERVEAVIDRVEFLEVGTQGVLPRGDPVAEQVATAHVGVTFSYLTSSMPEDLSIRWIDPEGDVSVPATITDPESSRTGRLSATEPVMVWVNALMEDPVPTVESVTVEPKTYVLPLFSIPLFVVSLVLLYLSIRGRRRVMSFAWARVAFAVALLVGPNGRLNLDLEASTPSAPSIDVAQKILVNMLPNIYRAFEFREESAVYDRLAVNVTGETLSGIYLEHRRALEMEERGGARARVEAVEVPEVRSVEPTADGGFDVEATWLVGGTVTHFGHRHFRQNRYDARVSLVPIEGNWKIAAIEIFDEERLR